MIQHKLHKLWEIFWGFSLISVLGNSRTPMLRTQEPRQEQHSRCRPSTSSFAAALFLLPFLSPGPPAPAWIWPRSSPPALGLMCVHRTEANRDAPAPMRHSLIVPVSTSHNVARHLRERRGTGQIAEGPCNPSAESKAPVAVVHYPLSPSTTTSFAIFHSLFISVSCFCPVQNSGPACT